MKNTFYLLTIVIFTTIFGLTACGRSEVNKLPPPKNEANSEKPAAPAPAASNDPAAGQKLFVSNCSACHGPNGEGVKGLGKSMQATPFITGKTDDELVAFIKAGRTPSDPLNTTGVAMPPNGGNPTLSDNDLINIVAYIRSLKK